MLTTGKCFCLLPLLQLGFFISLILSENFNISRSDVFFFALLGFASMFSFSLGVMATRL